MYFVTDFIIETPTFLLLASIWFYKLFSPARIHSPWFFFPDKSEHFLHMVDHISTVRLYCRARLVTEL